MRHTKPADRRGDQRHGVTLWTAIRPAMGTAGEVVCRQLPKWYRDTPGVGLIQLLFCRKIVTASYRFRTCLVHNTGNTTRGPPAWVDDSAWIRSLRLASGRLDGFSAWAVLAARFRGTGQSGAGQPPLVRQFQPPGRREHVLPIRIPASQVPRQRRPRTYFQTDKHRATAALNVGLNANYETSGASPPGPSSVRGVTMAYLGEIHANASHPRPSTGARGAGHNLNGALRSSLHALPAVTPYAAEYNHRRTKSRRFKVLPAFDGTGPEAFRGLESLTLVE